MRSTGLTPRPNSQRQISNRPPLRLRTPVTTTAQYSALDFAIQTLDNLHTLSLLQSLRVVPQHLLCLRTRLAHQLNQHRSCLQFSAQSLKPSPCCTPCLQVYLAHAHQHSSSPSIRPYLLQSLSQEGSPQALQWLLRLGEMGSGWKRYQRLMDELRVSEGRLQKVSVVQVQANERKIIATSQIHRDEVILFIPKQKLITLQLARTLPLVDRLYGLRVQLKSPKHTQLAVYLLHQFEKGEHSIFHNYLATLPTDFTRFPINYPQELLNELQGTSFMEQVQAKQQDLHRDYEVVCNADESFSRFSYQRFVEARLLVCSRVFGVVVERVKTDALVPLADMLNHHMPKQTSWYYCDSSHGFVIQSLKDISPGSEIFDSYGQKCNSRFLLNYAFTVPDNPHNEVTLTITSNSRRHSSTRVRVSRIIESKAFDDLIGVLRAVANSHSTPDPKAEQEDELENAKETPFTSIEREVRAWQLLEGIVSDRLNEYPTTLAQDRRLLEQAEGRLSDVITLRMGEKEVLHFYLTMARKVSKSLGNHSRRSELCGYEAYLSGLELQGRTEQ